MADAYNFGAMLEVVSGMMAVGFCWPEALLVMKVANFEASQRPLEELADRRLDGHFDREQLKKLPKLGIACTCLDPESRSSIRQIVSILDDNDEFLMSSVRKKQKS